MRGVVLADRLPGDGRVGRVERLDRLVDPASAASRGPVSARSAAASSSSVAGRADRAAAATSSSDSSSRERASARRSVTPASRALARRLEAEHGAGHRDVERLGRARPSGCVTWPSRCGVEVGAEAVGLVAEHDRGRAGEVDVGVAACRVPAAAPSRCRPSSPSASSASTADHPSDSASTTGIPKIAPADARTTLGL